MPWINVFSIVTTDFPASVIPASFGISPNSIATETYQLSSYDKTTKVRLTDCSISVDYHPFDSSKPIMMIFTTTI